MELTSRETWMYALVSMGVHIFKPRNIWVLRNQKSKNHSTNSHFYQVCLLFLSLNDQNCFYLLPPCCAETKSCTAPPSSSFSHRKLWRQRKIPVKMNISVKISPSPVTKWDQINFELALWCNCDFTRHSSNSCTLILEKSWKELINLRVLIRDDSAILPTVSHFHAQAWNLEKILCYKDWHFF